ncbi:TIGR03668 family PPOX class F420-dependent oxidoreductase [Streptomyces roseoverticillatus]|uniref:TIGR03668 family PPOX class F420-dependent oxidoreductase n=1 Tax=Streptomyces roseoverticillatus TaxID=66429 RepID=UPI001F16C362|nr:TIGR03668 family PPOX class F420-dependent oxidoreductase [Streptomyces roseoverticillatus]MCF3103841.1 TIGR03668 family PPOX class F420-dependent oxidoreductase [Streptomyces roseoverticillatus]
MRLGSAEARARFTAAPVARLATADQAGVPHLVPVTFAVDGDTVYFAVDRKPKHTRDLRRLHNIRQNPRVALLADHYADDWTALWWARADGRAAIWTDEARCRTPLGLLAEKYPQYRDRPPEGPVVAVEVEGWSGWAFADPAEEGGLVTR